MLFPIYLNREMPCVSYTQSCVYLYTIIEYVYIKVCVSYTQSCVIHNHRIFLY